MSRKPSWRPTGRAIVVLVSLLIGLPVGLVGTLHANLFRQELAEHLRTFLTTEVQSGNRVVIKCSRVRRLTVQLHPSLVDFSKKVKVLVNGRIVFFGMVKPKPLTLLNSAAEEFDFQRLPYASVTVPAR